MSRYFLYGTRFSEFEQMMMLVPNFTPKKKGVIITEDLIISNGQSVASYKILLRKCFGNLHHRYLNKRLSKLLQKFRGDLFLSDVHRHRFSSCCTPYANKRTCAVLYLISATDDLWARASPHISSGKINLVAIPLLCLDNDDAGQKACDKFQKLLTERELTVTRLVPTLKDFNEDLVEQQKALVQEIGLKMA